MRFHRLHFRCGNSARHSELKTLICTTSPSSYCRQTSPSMRNTLHSCHLHTAAHPSPELLHCADISSGSRLPVYKASPSLFCPGSVAFVRKYFTCTQQSLCIAMDSFYEITAIAPATSQESNVPTDYEKGSSSSTYCVIA